MVKKGKRRTEKKRRSWLGRERKGESKEESKRIREHNICEKRREEFKELRKRRS